MCVTVCEEVKKKRNMTTRREQETLRRKAGGSGFSGTFPDFSRPSRHEFFLGIDIFKDPRRLPWQSRLLHRSFCGYFFTEKKKRKIIFWNSTPDIVCIFQLSNVLPIFHVSGFWGWTFSLINSKIYQIWKEPGGYLICNCKFMHCHTDVTYLNPVSGRNWNSHKKTNLLIHVHRLFTVFFFFFLRNATAHENNSLEEHGLKTFFICRTVKFSVFCEAAMNILMLQNLKAPTSICSFYYLKKYDPIQSVDTDNQV